MRKNKLGVMMNAGYFCSLLGVVGVIATLSGCSQVPTGATERVGTSSPFAAPTHLVATLVDPINIELTWRDHASNEAGYFVEYSPDANDEFVIIDALPPNATHYRHARLLPETRFVYRVRPFFGGVSNIAEVTTGKEAPQQPPAVEPRAASATPGGKHSLRSIETADAARASGLTATLIPPAGVALAWEDRAADADGYLLEIRPPWDPEFKVSSFLEPGTSAIVTYGFPFETRFELRVRAFFYGAPSNIAEKTTGHDPTLAAMNHPTAP